MGEFLMNLKFITLIGMIFLFSSVTFGVEEWNIEHEFIPDEFIFEYNDHNTTVYEGDSGLKLGHVNNTADNTTLIIPIERVRSLAYASKGTFKFDEPLIITHSIQRDDGRYILLTMKYKNGTVIPILDIKENSLTNEQKEYFDDYDTQRSEYLEQQQQYMIEDIEDSVSRHNSRSNSKSKYSYYYGTNGYGLVYNP